MNKKTLGTGMLMSPQSMRSIQLVCLWTAIPMVIMLFGGLWGIAGFIPPHPPSASAEEIAAIYRSNTLSIRFGLALSFLSIGFIFTFGSAIAAQIRRIEGASSVLTYTQVASYSSGSLVFICTWIFWFAAAFRPERADTQILLLNDLGWIFFVTAFIAFTIWNFALGTAILADKSAQPIFPRWSGFFNFFVGMSFFPDICVPFFLRGVLSWEGIFPFYLPFFVYFVWIIVMLWLTTKAITADPALNDMTSKL